MNYRIKKTSTKNNHYTTPLGETTTTYRAQVFINGDWRNIAYKTNVGSEVIFSDVGYFSQDIVERIIEDFNWQERGKEEDEFRTSKVEIFDYKPMSEY